MDDAASTIEGFALGFVDALRRRGAVIGLDRALSYQRALTVVDFSKRAEVYWAGRATLLGRPEDLADYDDVFASWWLTAGDRIDPASASRLAVDVGFDDEPADGPSPPELRSGDTRRPIVTVRWSPAEALRRRDFATYDPGEIAEARRLIARLRLRGAMRRSHRWEPSRARTGRLDTRATVRAMMRTHGELVARPTRRRRDVARRVIVLCDISGSMEPYARPFARFAHAVANGRRRVEIFTIGTRMTRVTHELRSHDPDAALAAVAATVRDWSGGTRLGEGLRTFNDSWGSRGLARGAVVLILSDGWDRGDVLLLGREMQRLRRTAHRIVWVNPLKASEGYEPTAQGMAAALPWIDELVEGHSLGSLEDLVEVIAR